MSEIPGARVVRGGEGGSGSGGEGARRPGAVVDPQGRVLRLAPRALVWRLLFGGTIALVGWMFAVSGLVFTLICVPMMDLSFDYDRRAIATVTHIENTRSAPVGGPARGDGDPVDRVTSGRS